MKTQARPLKALATQALLAIGLLFSTAACDEGATGPEAPEQHIESDLPAGVAIALLDAADMGPSDLAAADFAIYSMDADSEDARNELPQGCMEKSVQNTECGVCMCDGNGAIYCIDYACDDVKSAGGELDLATPPLAPTPSQDEEERSRGDLQLNTPPVAPLPPMPETDTRDGGDLGVSDGESDEDQDVALPLEQDPAESPEMGDWATGEGDEDRLSMQGHQYATGSCSPGEAWETGCNVCICDANGQSVCTAATCGEELPF